MDVADADCAPASSYLVFVNSTPLVLVLCILSSYRAFIYSTPLVVVLVSRFCIASAEDTGGAELMLLSMPIVLQRLQFSVCAPAFIVELVVVVVTTITDADCAATFAFWRYLQSCNCDVAILCCNGALQSGIVFKKKRIWMVGCELFIGCT